MKHTLALVLIVSGIVGCATTPSQSQLSGMSNLEVCQKKINHKGEERYPYLKEELKRKIDCGKLNLKPQPQLSKMSDSDICENKLNYKGEERYPYVQEELKRKINCGNLKLVSQDKDNEKGFIEKVITDVIAGYPAAKLEAQKKQEAYNRGVRQGQAAQRAKCNNQQGNC